MTFWFSRVAASMALTMALSFPASAQSFGVSEARCVLKPFRDSALSSAGRELVTERLVSRGDRVETGDVLMRFFSGGIEGQRLRAEKELILAQQQLDRVTRLGSVVTASERAEAQMEVEMREADMLELSLEMARFEIRAPHPGIVLETPVSVGEALEDGPALRLVQVDQLRAEFDLPLGLLGQFADGDTIEVLDELDRSRGAQVVFVDPVVDLASRSFRMHAVLDNASEDWTAGSLCFLQKGDTGG